MTGSGTGNTVEPKAHHNEPKAHFSDSKAKWISNLLAVLSLIGLVLSIILTSHFYSLRNGTAGFTSSCDVSSAINCSVVGASSYSEFLGGIPLSGFSMGWFAGLILVSLIIRSREWRRDASRAALVMVGFGTLMSVIYFVIMATQLKTYCLYCLGIDAVNGLSLLLVLALKPWEHGKAGKGEAGKWKSLVGIAAAYLFIGVVSTKAFDDVQVNASDADETVSETLGSPVLSVGSGDSLPSMGPKDAKVTVVEFADFECPHCRLGASGMHTLLARYPTQLRVVFRNFPLNVSCNPHGGQIHPASCDAAKAAICAHKQGKFEPVYQTLFENQEKLKPGKVLDELKDLGLDMGQMASCMDSADTLNAVARDVEEGNALGINSTPTFFVNGHKLLSFRPVMIWVKLIDQLLK